MKNFEHECNGKVEDSNLEAQYSCDKCNCENYTQENTCECSCHSN